MKPNTYKDAAAGCQPAANTYDDSCRDTLSGAHSGDSPDARHEPDSPSNADSGAGGSKVVRVALWVSASRDYMAIKASEIGLVGEACRYFLFADDYEIELDVDVRSGAATVVAVDGLAVAHKQSGAEIDALAPVPMLLTCPACGERHIDKGAWATKRHHTHACQHCGLVWRPAIVATVGVRFLPGFKDEHHQSDCPSKDRCHGTMAWCEACGDVSVVCDDVACDWHNDSRDAEPAPGGGQ